MNWFGRFHWDAKQERGLIRTWLEEKEGVEE